MLSTIGTVMKYRLAVTRRDERWGLTPSGVEVSVNPTLVWAVRLVRLVIEPLTECQLDKRV